MLSCAHDPVVDMSKSTWLIPTQVLVLMAKDSSLASAWRGPRPILLAPQNINDRGTQNAESRQGLHYSPESVLGLTPTSLESLPTTATGQQQQQQQ